MNAEDMRETIMTMLDDDCIIEMENADPVDIRADSPEAPVGMTITFAEGDEFLIAIRQINEGA